MLRFLTVILILTLILTTDALAQIADGGGGDNSGWWKGDDTPAFAGGVIRQAYCDVISYMEGSLGGMLMVAAGVLAMATAAFGNFKHGVTAIAVGIACFSMSAVVSLFFGQLCDANGAAKGVNNQGRVFQEQILDAPNLDFENTAKEDPFDL